MSAETPTSNENNFIVPKKHDNLNESEKAKKDETTTRLEAKGIYGYESNELSIEDEQKTLKKINELISTSKSEEEKSALEVFARYIEKHHKVFPDFSHGTSSDALPAIIRAGILPKAMAKSLYQDDPMMQSLGEGNKGGAGVEEDDNWWISAGAGQGGLGTAIAYSEMIPNKDWNPNNYSEEELSQEIQKCEDKLLKKNKQVFKNKLDRLKKSKLRLEKQISVDYPVVVGFNRTRKYADPSDLPEGQWPRLFQSNIRGSSITGFNHELDSEIIIGEKGDPDQVLSWDISAIVCPFGKIAEVQKIIQENSKNRDIEIIPLEVFQKAKELGLDRISKAEKATFHRITDNLNLGKLEEILS